MKSPLVKISRVQRKLVTDSVQKKQMQSKIENCPPVLLPAQGNDPETPIIETALKTKGEHVYGIRETPKIHSSPPKTDSVQKTLRRSPRINSQISKARETAIKLNTEKNSKKKTNESLKAVC